MPRVTRNVVRMPVLLLPNASSLYHQSIDPGYRSPQWYPSLQQRMYRDTLAEMERIGGPLRLVQGVQRGVASCVYALIPDGVSCSHGNPKSKVIVIPTQYVTGVPDDGYAPAPIEDRNLSGSGAWWKQEGLDVVRLLTSWVDGFMAFVPATAGAQP